MVEQWKATRERGVLDYKRKVRGYAGCLELWLYICSTAVLFHYYWCTRKPQSSSIILFENNIIAHDHHTNNNLYIFQLLNQHRYTISNAATSASEPMSLVLVLIVLRGDRDRGVSLRQHLHLKGPSRKVGQGLGEGGRWGAAFVRSIVPRRGGGEGRGGREASRVEIEK